MNLTSPFTVRRDKTDPMRRKWEGILAQHMADLPAIFEAYAPDDKIVRKRIQAVQMMMVAEASSMQAHHALMKLANSHFGISQDRMSKLMRASGEAVSTGTNVVADIVAFVTQTIHTTLEIWPRLLSSLLCSMQPLLQPSGYVFFYKHYDQTGRDLADLSQFQMGYTADPGEGEQIKKVRTKVTKELVEASYRKIMTEWSHETDVAMASTYKMSIENINDGIMAREMMWEIDRTVIDRLYDFAGLGDYYFNPDYTDQGTSVASLVPTEQTAWWEMFLRRTYNQVETDMQAAVYQKPNWAIAGNTMIAFLKRLGGKFESKPAAGARQFGDQVLTKGTLQVAGYINGDVTVWHDPQMDTKEMLVGYTDDMDPMYAGFIFSPFGAASVLTAAFTDPNFLLTRKARATAFATKGVRSKQYARIHLGSRS